LRVWRPARAGAFAIFGLGVCTAPGDGMIDHAAVSRELRGYSGWAVSEAEQDPKTAPALTYARKGIAHLEAALAAVGLK
jgi:sugar phosphate isomerase/epimerase